MFSEFKRVIRIASARLATFEGLLVLIKDISSLQFTKITKLLFNLKVGLLLLKFAKQALDLFYVPNNAIFLNVDSHII